MCKRMRGAFNQIALAKHCGEAPGKCISQIYFCMKAQFCFILKRVNCICTGRERSKTVGETICTGRERSKTVGETISCLMKARSNNNNNSAEPVK